MQTYSIQVRGPHEFTVTVDGGAPISTHETRGEAAKAIARYHAADRRRKEAQRTADRIDGYDRDDLGDSPDF